MSRESRARGNLFQLFNRRIIIMSLNWRSSFICLLIFVLNGVVLNAQTKTQSGYRVLKQYKLGGEGGWDCLTIDAKARRVYLSHATHVMVVEADSGAIG